MLRNDRESGVLHDGRALVRHEAVPGAVHEFDRVLRGLPPGNDQLKSGEFGLPQETHWQHLSLRHVPGLASVFLLFTDSPTRSTTLPCSRPCSSPTSSSRSSKASPSTRCSSNTTSNSFSGGSTPIFKSSRARTFTKSSYPPCKQSALNIS